MQPETAPAGECLSLIHPLTSILDHVELGKLFPADLPLEVELGSGDSTFLVEYARRHAEHNFIGVERLLGRIRKLDRKGRRAGLMNLRGLRIESAYFLEYLLPPHSAVAVHIYFPDPWPKRKHRRHRLINERFPTVAQQALAPGGTVYLRTDDANYFEQMLGVFAAAPAFRPVDTPAELSAELTDFEKGFHARGIKSLLAAYCLITDYSPPHLASNINDRAAAAATGVGRGTPALKTDPGFAAASDQVQQHRNDADDERAQEGGPEGIDCEESPQQKAHEV